MTNEHPSDESLGQPSTPDAAEGQRKRDDRRNPVSPTENPVPNSPEADEEAVRKGEETLERVKPY